MRIVLVHPKGSNWTPGKKDVTTTANRMAPLGLLSIASYLEKDGHQVSVMDCLGPEAESDNSRIAKRIVEHDPDIVGFSATTSGFPDGYDIACRVRTEAPETTIVFGGVHVSALGESLLRQFPEIDCLVLGEGEVTLAELASGRPLHEIDGLVWKENGNPVKNPPRTGIQDLDSLPFPAYEKLDGFPARYHLPLFSYIQAPGATMITSRGCPYKCSYCDRSVFKQSYRYNSAEYVYAHIRYLRTRFGVKHINIYDDLFTTHRKRIAELCKMLIDRPPGMHFNCAVRVGHADDELLRMLKAAGFLQVSLGIETGDSDLMAEHKPGVKIQSVRDTVERIKKAGLRVKGLFMMGLPGDTVESIRKTSDFVISLGLDDMNMSKFTPFPGAPVWDTIHEHGRFEEDWRKMNCLNFVFIPKGVPSKEVLDHLYNTHVKRFYTDKGWRRRFRKRIWEHRHSLFRLLIHLPDFLSAMRNFEPD